MAWNWANAKYDWRDLSEKPDPVVERTQMDRGIPKQRRMSSDQRIELTCTIYFDTAAEIDDFEAWFYGAGQAGQAYFDLPHPRKGTLMQARIVNGDIGELRFLNSTLAMAQRSLRIEWWVSAW